jgi:hypothetical protein
MGSPEVPRDEADFPGDDRDRRPDQIEPLGGADAVEKTTYVVGEGTDPSGRPKPGTVPPTGDGGTNPVVWLTIAIAVIVGLIYILGFLA